MYFGQSAYASLKLKKLLRNCDVIMTSIFSKLPVMPTVRLTVVIATRMNAVIKMKRFSVDETLKNTYQLSPMSHGSDT